MEPALKQRLIGAAVLVALAVIFLPMLIQGPAPESGVSDVPLALPNAPAGEYETRDLPLVTPGEAPGSGVVGMDARVPEGTSPDDGSATMPLDNPDAANPVSTATPLGSDAGVVTAPIAAPGIARPTTPVTATMFPAPTAGGDFAVNFGAFSTVAAADKIVASLRASQLPGYRQAASVDGRTVQRVRIGPYATRAEAEAARLRAAHVRDDVGAKVVTLDAGAATPKPAAPVAKPVASSAPTAAAKPAAPTPSPTVASSTGFAVQLAAFSKADDAIALRDRLRAAGFTAFTESVSTDKGTLTRVRVGPVLNRNDADQLRAQVKSRIGLDGIVRPHP